MTTLEDLRPEATVRGILPDGAVTVVTVKWFGSEALEVTYKTPEGSVAKELVYRDDEPRLEIVELGRPWLRGVAGAGGGPVLTLEMRNAPFGASGRRCYHRRGVMMIPTPVFNVSRSPRL